MAEDLSLLDAQLLALGRKEKILEEAIQSIPSLSREAALRGDFQRADELFRSLDDARTALRSLQKDITAIEVRLYRLRRATKQ